MVCQPFCQICKLTMILQYAKLDEMLSTYSQLETLRVLSNQLCDLDLFGIFTFLNSLTYLDLSDNKINQLVGSNTRLVSPNTFQASQSQLILLPERSE